jgi:RNA polymerase sigma-70 factor (family 1)
MLLTDPDNEKALLKKIASGDQKAFTQLFKKEYKRINSFAFRLTRSNDASKEIVQDIFLKLWLNREVLASVDNWGGYLNRIVRNHIYNINRRSVMQALASDELSRQSTELDTGMEDAINYRGTRDLINEAIATLSPQQQKVYILCHQQGLKYAEAAERLNIAPETVKGYMKQALRSIRLYVTRYAPAIIFSSFLTPGHPLPEPKTGEAYAHCVER